MIRYYQSFSPPLRSFFMQRGRDRKKITAWIRRDRRERSRERGGATKVHAAVWLLFSVPKGVKGESLAHDIFAAKLKVS